MIVKRENFCSSKDIIVAKFLMVLDGIIPSIDATFEEVNDALSKLSLQEQRKIKRKFRKIVRKIGIKSKDKFIIKRSVERHYLIRAIEEYEEKNT